MPGISDRGTNISVGDTIDKRHSKLEFLQPVIHIRDGFDQDLLTIPFNHIISFEYSVMESQGQAHLEFFDPTQRLLDVVMFNAMQEANNGVELKIRWGYAFVPAGQNLNSEFVNSTLRDEYLSQFYNFRPIQVIPDYKPAGTTIGVNLAPHTFDPVMTGIQATDVFVSGSDVAPPTTDTIDAIKATFEGTDKDKQAEKYLATIAAYKKLTAGSQKGASVATSDPNIGGDAIVFDGKLTFSKIYFKLIDIANQSQVRLGPRARTKLWQKPVPIFPDTIDDEFDYQIFECRNDNIWTCLTRLCNQMVSKKPDQATSPTYSNLEQGAKSAQNRMVGGKMTLHNTVLRNPSSQIIIKDSDNNTTTPEKVDPDQQTFIMFQFNDAPYDYMIKDDNGPIATYVYYGGSKEFDQNNLPEILEFNVVNNDTISSYFANKDIFTTSAITNPTTNVSIQPQLSDSALTAQTAVPIKQGASLEDLRKTGAEQIVKQNDRNKPPPPKSTSDGTQTGTTGDTQTNPNHEQAAPGTTSTSTIAHPVSAQPVQFDVPAVVSQDGETVSPVVDRFLDFLRTKVGRLYNPELEVTIMGDPRWEPTYAAYETVHLIFRNRFGDENPIFSGIYFVRDIKHSIQNTFKTILHCVKVQQKNSNTSDDASINEANASKDFGKTTPIPIVLLQVTITGAGMSGADQAQKWRIAFAGTTPQIQSVPDNANAERINSEILKRQADGGKTVINDLSDFLNDALTKAGQVTFSGAKQKLGDSAHKITYVDGNTAKVTTNFLIKIVNQAA